MRSVIEMLQHLIRRKHNKLIGVSSRVYVCKFRPYGSLTTNPHVRLLGLSIGLSESGKFHFHAPFGERSYKIQLQALLGLMQTRHAIIGCFGRRGGGAGITEIKLFAHPLISRREATKNI